MSRAAKRGAHDARQLTAAAIRAASNCRSKNSKALLRTFGK
jgi:hypothetical protein